MHGLAFCGASHESCLPRKKRATPRSLSPACVLCGQEEDRGASWPASAVDLVASKKRQAAAVKKAVVVVEEEGKTNGRVPQAGSGRRQGGRGEVREQPEPRGGTNW